MSLVQNLSLLAIILIYFVQKSALETNIPTTTSSEDLATLTTADLEDLFKAYDAQYPPQNVGEIGEEEYQNDGKIVGVLEDIDKVIVSIEKILGELQKDLAVDNAPKPGEDVENYQSVERKKRTLEDKQIYDINERIYDIAEEASQQVNLLSGLKENLKSKKLRNLQRIIWPSRRNTAKVTEKVYEEPMNSHETLMEHVLETMRDNQLEKEKKVYFQYFLPTSTTTYPPISKIKNKIVAQTDDFYVDYPSDRHTRSVDSQFFSSLASYLMPSMRSFGPEPESGEEMPVKRQIDAHNDLENDVIPTIQHQATDEVNHPESESPVVEFIQTIADPETRLELAKELESAEPQMAADLQEFLTEEPPKDVTEGETDKREIVSTDAALDVTTVSEEILVETTTESAGNFYISSQENEIVSEDKEVMVIHQNTDKERFKEEYTETPYEFTTVSYQEETTLRVNIDAEGHHVLAENEFEEEILMPEVTTLNPDTANEDKIDPRKHIAENEILGENFATDFPRVTEFDAATEAEMVTTSNEFEKKVKLLKKDLEKDSAKSSSSSSSEESHEKASKSSTSEASESSTTTSLNIEGETLTKGDLYDLLSHPMTQGPTDSIQDVQELAKKESKSRSLDISQRMIVSQSPEEISALEEENKPVMDNHSVRKKQGVSREILPEDTTTEVIPVTEGRSLNDDVVEDTLQTVVDAVDIVMDTKKTVEAFHDAVETTEAPLTTDRSPAPTKNTRDVVGFGLDDSPLGHEESLPLDRTPSESSTVVLTTALSAIMAVILLLGFVVFSTMRIRVRRGIDLAAV